MFDQFVIRAPSETNGETGMGYWSNEHGWTVLVGATVFSIEEMRSVQLPVAAASDAIWMPVAHAYDESLITLAEIVDTATLDWSQFDGFELQGIREEQDEFVPSADNPHFFSAYVHCRTGGVEWLGDFGSYQKAANFVADLNASRNWPVVDFVPDKFRHC